MERKVIINFGENEDTSIDFLLGAFYDARATTLQRVAGISKEELHWQYAEGWNSISVLLEHIVSCSYNFRIWLLEKRKFSEAELKEIIPGLDMGAYIPELIAKNKDLDYYLEKLSTSRKLMNEAISKMSFDDLKEMVPAYNEETGSNIAWILFHVVEDEIHHRGQISMIRKLYQLRNK